MATAKDIWEAVKQTYSVDQDASKVYQLHCEVIFVRQNGGSVLSYFGKLQKIWQELDDIDDCIMECPNDIVTYNTKVNSQRVYLFLAGLNPQLDGVRGRVLATKPLPNIQAIYAMVCAEANRQEAMLGGTIGEGAVMASRKMPTSKKDRKCTHCNGTGHTVETCFQLHGYPDWHPKGKKTSYVSSNAKELDSKGNLATTPGFTAKSGMSFTSNSDWIIDSGATDHMTCDRYRFSHLSPKCSKTTITNANGVSSPVIGVGTVPLSPTLAIKDVLFVPSLNCNLLSVTQLTKSHNCVALFFPTHCIFQNIHTREKIGSGRRIGGLYYLEDGFQHSDKKGQAHVVNEDLVNKKQKEIWLWHRRLGHPSFSYLRRLFPSLFSGCNVSDFICETYVRAKSHRTTFHLSNNKANFPFSLVHSDVWGPAPISTLNGMRWFVSFVDDCTRMTWVYQLKHKSDVCSIFRMFHQMVTTQFGIPIKVLRSDNGGEYVKQDLLDFMHSVGIIHQTTCLGSP